MDRVLVVDCDRCTGCGVCELACSLVRHGAFNPTFSLIHVLRHRQLDVSVPVVEVACDCCGRCVEWCSEAAIEFVDWGAAAILRKREGIGRFPAPVVGAGEPGCSGPAESPAVAR